MKCLKRAFMFMGIFATFGNAAELASYFCRAGMSHRIPQIITKINYQPVTVSCLPYIVTEDGLYGLMRRKSECVQKNQYYVEPQAYFYGPAWSDETPQTKEPRYFDEQAEYKSVLNTAYDIVTRGSHSSFNITEQHIRDHSHYHIRVIDGKLVYVGNPFTKAMRPEKRAPETYVTVFTELFEQHYKCAQEINKFNLGNLVWVRLLETPKKQKKSSKDKSLAISDTYFVCLNKDITNPWDMQNTDEKHEKGNILPRFVERRLPSITEILDGLSEIHNMQRLSE